MIVNSRISHHPFLTGLEPEHLNILARHAREAEFEANQIICHESQSANQFNLILEGKAVVESYVARAQDIPLQIIEGGDVIGWSWLFPPFIWHLQVRALERVKAIVLDGARLRIACEHDHSFGYALLERIAQVIIKRLEEATKRLLRIRKAAEVACAADDARSHGAARQLMAKTPEAMLAGHPFLKGMSIEHLKFLAGAAVSATFIAGEIIFRQGGLANQFYLIQHGKVILEGSRTEKSAAPIQIIGDEEVLGWSWMFPPYHSHFDARALERTEAVCLDGAKLREECEADHAFGYDLMKRACRVLIERLQATRRRLLEASEVAN